jgi:CheY-like chemotaxis protein
VSRIILIVKLSSYRKLFVLSKPLKTIVLASDLLLPKDNCTTSTSILGIENRLISVTVEIEIRVKMILDRTISEVDDRALDLAPVLLVDDDVASRLTLQTLLRAGGYNVDVASSAAEAIEKLDSGQYVLVLSDLGIKSPEEGLKVLAYARLKEYRPATASVTAYHGSKPLPSARATDIVVETEDVPRLLTKVAELIGLRAIRRVQRQVRHALS